MAKPLIDNPTATRLEAAAKKFELADQRWFELEEKLSKTKWQLIFELEQEIAKERQNRRSAALEMYRLILGKI